MTLPDILNFGLKVDEEKLWKEILPVEEIPISDLKNNLDIPFLEQEGTDDWNLTPRMLLENFDKEKTHAAIVEGVNLEYPIELYFHHGQWIILDGVHRYVKVLRMGLNKIKVRRISQEVAHRNKRTIKMGDTWDRYVNE